MSIGEIDWKTVKSITVKKALPCYFSGNSNRLIPFLVLFTTVDDGHESLDVQIECPVIDEAKLRPIVRPRTDNQYTNPDFQNN